MNLTGLDDVTVAETRLSDVDGERGELLVAGHTLDSMADWDYESAYRLLLGEAPDLGQLREKAYLALKPCFALLQAAPSPLEGLRLGLACLPESCTEYELVGAFPVLLGAVYRGDTLPPPDSAASHGEDLLKLMFGKRPSLDSVRALNTYLVTVCEHGMNASTFAARVVASTGATPLAATLAALGALSGPLHGGAPGPVLDLLDEMAGCPSPAQALEEKVRKGQRLMGFGHRIYRTRDPRADVLKQAVRALDQTTDLQLAEKVEAAALEVLRAAKPDRVLDTNVEFYTAVLLNALGFERSWFTPLFAAGRILGWMAHYKEQRETGRLLRPKSRYVGPRPQTESERVSHEV